MMSGTSRKLLGFLVMVVVADIVALGIFFTLQSPTSSYSGDVLAPLPPSNSTLGVFSKAAVVAAGGPCAGIGKDMLDRGGNAVDAAIASLLCEGVCTMQSMGVGGGFIMILYNKTEGKSYSLVARETAPGAATKDMFVNQTNLESQLGPLAVAVPGELKGYQEAHKRFGKLRWQDLFYPTIKLCEEGVPVNLFMERAALQEENNIKTQPTFTAMMLNSTKGRLPKAGDILKLPTLANTLRIIAESPIKADELYNGSLTKSFVEDIRSAGGIITEEDMNNYNVVWDDPLNATLSDKSTVFTSPLPGSGILVNFMLRLLDGLLQLACSDTVRSQYMVEAFKHAYGRRTDLSDPLFANKTVLDQTIFELTNQESILDIRSKIFPNWTSHNVSYYGADFQTEDHGTDNVVVIDLDGNAVSVTSTVNLYFGSKFVSTSTGILLNNEMDDFSTPGLINYFGVPPSEANFIAPGKRPMSSMAPTVVVDNNGDARLVVSGAGGSQITTQVTSVIIRNLWLGKNIKESIDAPRFHHQLLPMNISYEYGILKEVVDDWHSIGHSTVRIPSNKYLAIITGIARLGENITANCDYRRPGNVEGF